MRPLPLVELYCYHCCPPLYCSFPNLPTSLHPFVCRDQLQEEGAGEDKKTDHSVDGYNHRAQFRLTITGNLGRRLIAQVCEADTRVGKTHTRTGAV